MSSARWYIWCWSAGSGTSYAPSSSSAPPATCSASRATTGTLTRCARSSRSSLCASATRFAFCRFVSSSSRIATTGFGRGTSTRSSQSSGRSSWHARVMRCHQYGRPESSTTRCHGRSERRLIASTCSTRRAATESVSLHSAHAASASDIGRTGERTPRSSICFDGGRAAPVAPPGGGALVRARIAEALTRTLSPESYRMW